MHKIIAVIKREYLERVRLKWFIIGTVFGPILMGVLIFLPAWLASRTKPSREVGNVVIIDASGGGLGERVVRGLGGVESRPEVRLTEPAAIAEAESIATREVVTKAREGYLVVDRLTLAGERARYAGRNASTIPDMQRLEGAVKSAITTLRFEEAGLDARQVQALSRVDLAFATERLSERGRGGAGRGNVVLAYAVAMLLYMSIVLYGQAIMMSVIEEKTQRVAEVVVASVSTNKLLAGKVIGVGAVGLTQQLVWVVSGVVLLRLQGPIGKVLGIAGGVPLDLPSVTLGTGIAFVGYFVLGYALYATMFAAAGSMVSSPQDAQQVATPLTLLVVPSLLLLTPVLLEPSGTLSRAVTLIPFTSPILMPVRMSLTSLAAWELAASLALLVATVAGALWLAARIYRTGALMYGKKATLGEVARWVRQSR